MSTWLESSPENGSRCRPRVGLIEKKMTVEQRKTRTMNGKIGNVLHVNLRPDTELQADLSMIAVIELI
jgi:hypothetical protein